MTSPGMMGTSAALVFLRSHGLTAEFGKGPRKMLPCNSSTQATSIHKMPAPSCPPRPRCGAPCAPAQASSAGCIARVSEAALDMVSSSSSSSLLGPIIGAWREATPSSGAALPRHEHNSPERIEATYPEIGGAYQK